VNRRGVLAGLATTASAATLGGAASPAGAADALVKGAATVADAIGRPGKRFVAKDCIALVTGSNRGVGLGFVEVLLARGARRVYATGRRMKNLEAVVALDPKRVVPLVLDVTDDAQRRAAAAAAPDVTLLINNAAYPGSETASERRFRSAGSLDDARRVMDTNCWSPAELARLFIPRLVANGGGAIVNILSVGAFFCLPEFSSYSVSKAAAAIMTAGLRAETDRDPVQVCAVVTGGVQTRASPVGSKGGVTPVQHANEVFDAMAAGETEIYAAGARGFVDRLRSDPRAFERGVIERFHTNPVTIAPYDG
jgi:NAD(P)-dependent dehydrogenase (short-subunit alcohol dehydrogenase family)